MTYFKKVISFNKFTFIMHASINQTLSSTTEILD